MTRYWIKIGITALLIFGVGYTAYATGRRFVQKIKSDADLTIPMLGDFIPFKLDGTRIGSIRALTIQRSAPKQLSGFGIRARLTDSAGFNRVRECIVSVTNVKELDERTTFFCLKSDSGYRSFGEVRFELRVDGDTHSMIQPLFLPDSVVEKFLKEHHPSTGQSLGDSIAEGVRARVRVQSRAYKDSVRAASLERSARRMQEQADSIRGKAPKPPQNP